MSILTPEFIKTNRIRRGMSQGELAKLINIDNSTISYWEKGRSSPKSKYHETLYNILTDPSPYQNPKKEREKREKKKREKKDKPSFLTPEFIKTNRVRRGMRQKDLAELINVSSTTVISSWEKGRNSPQSKYHETLYNILTDPSPYQNPKKEGIKKDNPSFLTPEFIKTNRIRRGMRQKDLAELINVSSITVISSWEKGKYLPQSKYHETLYNILTDPSPYQNPKKEGIKKDNPSFLTPDFIKSNRERLGMTKKELADTCHVSFGAICRWENGESYPQIRCRKPLLDILSGSEPPTKNNIPTKRKSEDLSSILTPEFIKSNRIRLGMRQKDLAELINVSEITICQWEKGLHTPMLFHHKILMDILSGPSPYHDPNLNESSILTPEFIKTNRIRLGMRQSELAKLINVSIPTISRWETRMCKVSSKIALLLYDILTKPNT